MSDRASFFLRFPGEGRGPVGKVHVTTRNASQRMFHDWAPAFAGEALMRGATA